MTRLFALLLVICVSACSQISLKSDNDSQNRTHLSYQIEMMQQPFPMLKVEMNFIGDEDGLTEIDIPDHWASQKEFYNGIKNLRVHTAGASLSTTKSRNIVEVKHSPSAQIKLSYFVIQDFSGGINSDNYYRPIIQQDYFHIIGHGMFVQPNWDNDTTISVKFSWKLPKHWSIANSHSAEQINHFNTLQLGNLRQAVYLAGDFKINRLLIAKKPLFVATRGDWKFELKDYYQLIESIVSNEREFFNDYNYPYYLITMIPTDEPCCSTGGTGLRNSFSTFISHDLPSTASFKHLLAHELFHNWNGGIIGIADPEEIYYWFSEGFTDYYTRLLNLRAGIINLEEYFNDFNRIYKEYYLSPARNKTNQDVKQKFWINKDIGKLPYRRGDVLAHFWNTKLKAKGKHSIDPIMKQLFVSASTKGSVISNETLQQHFLPYLKDGIAADINGYIENGETIELNAATLGSCGSLFMDEDHQFELGFDFSASRQSGRITDLKSNSQATIAGLRKGQKMVGWSIHNGNIKKQVNITVILEDGTKKEISYFPIGKKIKFPQFKLDQKILQQNPQVCLDWFNN